MASRNLSVTQFQQLMARIPRQLAPQLRAPVFEAAQELASAMKAAVPKGVDGRHELEESIRVEDGKHPLRAEVKAGGLLTTRLVREGQKATYDYALGTEHGNERVSAQPFFFPTYRLLRKRLQSRIGRQIKPAIARIVKVE